MALDVKKLYYSIGEVSEIAGLKPYVLRYWETEFSNLSPAKNRAGNRIYTDKDINLILEIKRLLYQEKFTIKGARQYFKNNQVSDGDLSDPAPSTGATTRERQMVRKVLENVHSDLIDLIELIRKQK
ncbi:MAG: MerR family transcriptional regulator [Fidelibacterota bacterium]|nr:MAG: MerR family transcriptional regulator [Candidatus Neomarinimicrobiota bacterium]